MSATLIPRHKVVVARLSHESHAFSRLRTTLAEFGREELLFGDDIVGRMRGTRTEVGGIIDAAEAHGWQLVPTVSACAPTAGPVTRAAYDALTEPMLRALSENPDAAAVVLSLHGAMFVDGLPDPEGDLLCRIRQQVGPGVLVAATLDLHANVTDAMVRYADILTSYRTTPHVDQYQAGQRACALVQRALLGEIRPRTHLARRAMIAGMDLGRTLGDGPMTRLHARARDWEQREAAVLDVSLNAGYYMGDVYEAGPSALVVGDGDAALCQRVADELIDDAYSWRDQTTVQLQSIDEALARCREPAQRAGPLILADYTDGPGGGGYGDATGLLKALLAANLPGTLVGLLYDPESARQAIAAGVGQTLDLRIGGKTDPDFGGAPVPVQARVLAVSDGHFVRTGPFKTGTPASIGASALLQSGEVQIIVASNRVQAEGRDQYRALGVHIEGLNVVALKGINHFRADIEPIARGIVFVEAGGIHATDLSTLPYRNLRRPVWPLDTDAG
ncbi:M81 family metallopeptidase [Hydrogenophaga palleronii]|uniref:M81 family metallopeptidase n=1 Tax=Hydrogenophaga palleronii TaxID=65655 RepID=UPI00082625E6|nr:M81 family metallopeptidase [Hydrogenophaga palleronii]